jgi:hypothetical protein
MRIRRKGGSPVLRRSASIGTLVVIAVLVPPARAEEAPPCTFHPDDGVLEIVLPVQTWPFDPIVIARLGDAIAVNGEACPGATVTSTDTISVTGLPEPESGSHAVDIDLSGGPFAPGRTAEPDGWSQIEMTVDTGPSAGDQVGIIGGAEADLLTLHRSAIAFGADRDDIPDLRLLGMDNTECDGGSSCWTDSLRVDTGAGPDRLFLRPDPTGSIQVGQVQMGSGRDRVSADHARIFGGDGNDVMRDAGCALLYGGSGDDRLVAGVSILCSSHLVGEAGRDLLVGSSGGERLEGGPNADVLKAHGGPDTLFGGDGPDLMIGGAGSDALDGGEGRDHCDVDPADSNEIYCERVAQT